MKSVTAAPPGGTVIVWSHRAEKALEKLGDRHASERAAIDKEARALERRRKEMDRRHERERDKAEEKVESERESYETALARFESG